MIQPFDPNIPRDCSVLLRLLSFQTGHNPATHAGAYALDRAYPAKLQPDLVERYFQISEVWHRFLAIAGGSALTAGSDIYHSLQDGTSSARSVPRQRGDTSTTETIALTDVLSQDENGLQAGESVGEEDQQLRKRKRCEEGSRTATQEKIDALRIELAKLEREQQMQKICEAASQELLGQNDGGESSSIPSYRKRGSQVSLSNCASIICFMQAYSVLVYKQHHIAIVNLDKHLSRYHNVPASARKHIVDCSSRLKALDPAEVKLPDEPAEAIKELGKPLTGLQCKTCAYITISKEQVRMHCKKDHQQAWESDTSQMYSTVRVQSFFRTGGLQKYFRVR
jgi:hypothetical protein